ncbi:MAG: ABC transporter ATP-binding protein [Chloroflexota bacterium]
MTMIQATNIKRVLSLGDQQLEVLKGVSFEVAQGEWVALTGPSGSGKSTLLGLLAGIDTPTDGQLHLNGIDITHMREHQLARIRNQTIGIVFQSFNLISTLTAIENVEMPLYVSPQANKAKQLATQMLEQVGLGDRLHHRPHQLSGGQQQRVAIARALVTQPRILLADEPTGNLDTDTGTEILESFAQLNKQLNLTIVVVTHDPQVAASAERILHLVDGLLVRQQELISIRGGA